MNDNRTCVRIKLNWQLILITIVLFKLVEVISVHFTNLELYRRVTNQVANEYVVVETAEWNQTSLVVQGRVYRARCFIVNEEYPAYFALLKSETGAITPTNVAVSDQDLTIRWNKPNLYTFGPITVPIRPNTVGVTIVANYRCGSDNRIFQETFARIER